MNQQITPATASANVTPMYVLALNNECGEQAQALAVSALFRQLAFELPRAVFAPKKDTPVWDAATAAIMSDNGLPEQKPIDVETVIDGYAAGWALLTDICARPFETTGRKPDYLRKYLKSPVQLLTDNTENYLSSDAMAERSVKLRADAAALKVDPDVALKAVSDEMHRRATEKAGEIVPYWAQALKAAMKRDTAENIDILVDAVADCNRSPQHEVKGAAVAYINAMRKSMLAGKRVTVDNGIYALSEEQF